MNKKTLCAILTLIPLSAWAERGEYMRFDQMPQGMVFILQEDLAIEAGASETLIARTGNGNCVIHHDEAPMERVITKGSSFTVGPERGDILAGAYVMVARGAVSKIACRQGVPTVAELRVAGTGSFGLYFPDEVPFRTLPAGFVTRAKFEEDQLRTHRELRRALNEMMQTGRGYFAP